jgi:hypothetical protein
MLKFTRSYAVLSAAALMVYTPVAQARPSSGIPGYPVVPRSRTSSLICYMRTQKGAVIDLGRLCGDTFIPTGNTSTPDARRAASLPGGILPKRAPASQGGYGAIAFSPSTKRYGSTGPLFTKAEAEAQAKRACGQKDCTVGLSFRNTCGAFALNGNKPSYAKAGSEADASRVALLRAGKGGKVVLSFCSRQSPGLL